MTTFQVIVLLVHLTAPNGAVVEGRELFNSMASCLTAGRILSVRPDHLSTSCVRMVPAPHASIHATLSPRQAI